MRSGSVGKKEVTGRAHTCGLKCAMLSIIWLAAASSRMAPGSWPSVANALLSHIKTRIRITSREKKRV